MFTVTVILREITGDNAPAVLALRCTPEQERFVSSVADSLVEAAELPQGNPWFRAVYDDERPVGFVMLSWDVEPQPPEIVGPWFLWKLLTSHVPGEGGPAGSYARLGLVPTGALDPDGEIILRLALDE